MTTRLGAVAMGLLAVAGCASNSTLPDTPSSAVSPTSLAVAFDMEGMTQEQIRPDLAICQSEAGRASRTSVHQWADVLRLCMEAKGYTHLRTAPRA